MNKQELRKANGDVFFEAERSADNAFIFANWIGIQSMETLVLGGNLLLKMLSEKPCTGLLNSNRELVGPWEIGVNWLGLKWAPQARALGLRNFAQVMSHGVFGQNSFGLLEPLIGNIFKVRVFEEDELAKDWLQRQLKAPESGLVV